MKQTSKLRPGRRRALKGLIAVPLAPLAGACESILPGASAPPPNLYRLTPKSTFRPDLPNVNWQLILELPLANAGLNTTRIALWPSPTQVEYYAHSSWTDRAPAMVLTLMIESFENSDRIVSVGRESVGLRADFVLKSELREFQADYPAAGAPQANVGINVKLVQMPERVIIGSQKFRARVDATGDNMEAIIEAFDTALGRVLKNVVEWTLTTGEAAHQARRRRRSG